MIDSGAERSVISEDIFLKMELRRNDDFALIKGFRNTKKVFHTTVAVTIPELKQSALPINVLVNPNIKDAFDVILGNDFLEHFQFERDGQKKTFTLTFIEK